MFKKKIYRGWYIVTAIFFANWMGAGIGVRIYGLFYVPIRSSLSLTNLMLSLPPVIRNLTTHFMGPIVGPLVDKFGPRYLMTMGAIIAGFSTFLMSTADNFWEIILYFSIIGASGHACLSHIVTNTTSLHNEMLLQRISLIPLYIDPEKYRAIHFQVLGHNMQINFVQHKI